MPNHARTFAVLFLTGAATLLLASPGKAQTQLGYTISVFAGTVTEGYSGDGGPATSAQIGGPFGITADSNGNIYFADQYNNRIRKISGGTISTVAGSGVNSYTGDGKSATAGDLSHAEGVALDSKGDIFIADTNNYVIRKVVSGTITSVAGNHVDGGGYTGDGADANKAQLNQPAATVVNSAGDFYIVDTANNVIRLVTASTGFISTYAGNAFLGPGYSGDGGLAVAAQLNNPEGIAMDAAGNVYIADSLNHVIRKVTQSTGIMTTIAGIGIGGFAGDGGPAVAAELNVPTGLALDAAGNLYVADSVNSRIRVISTAGIITTIAGNGGFSESGDGGPATQASLYFPEGVTVDPSGNVYISDTQNNVIRKLTPVAGLPTIGTGGVISASGFGGSASITPGGWIEIYGTNLASDSRGWRASDFNGANAPTSLDGTSVLIGGQPAYVAYISSGQVNVQVPSSVATGSQTVEVTTAVGTSVAATVSVNATQPGLLAPASFKVSGTQYAAAIFPDFKTYVAPAGSISGVTSQAAAPGDTIVIYGVGFGPVSPSIPAGETVQGANMLVTPVQFFIGGAAATVTYQGLAPGYVGLYQFNVVVPSVAAGNAIPLTFTQGGVSGTQTLYTAVN